ncbi:hypothetical protein POM88_044937 [Heracleum sosnowskyi]|uniref:Uncharacterized protein n=1 Tax=Heracleum sosnowskyi TaxID=360622 RepID=A0AAD8H660_9APIA|nr:hypothetical protein POM88_044937 [Heracleum sosnowskyi]
MDASTPTQQQAKSKKRGRPKGSKTKEDRDVSAAKNTSSGGVAKMRGGDKKVAAVDDNYTHWKTLVPVLYDWWGPVLEEANQKNRQRIYLSEQACELPVALTFNSLAFIHQDGQFGVPLKSNPPANTGHTSFLDSKADCFSENVILKDYG